MGAVVTTVTDTLTMSSSLTIIALYTEVTQRCDNMTMMLTLTAGKYVTSLANLAAILEETGKSPSVLAESQASTTRAEGKMAVGCRSSKPDHRSSRQAAGNRSRNSCTATILSDHRKNDSSGEHQVVLVYYVVNMVVLSIDRGRTFFLYLCVERLAQRILSAATLILEDCSCT